MHLELATRQKAKIKMALQGPSGGGKTYSALLIAYGLTGNWNSIILIDTENGSSNLYAHLGNFRVLRLGLFTPEKYIEAINICLNYHAEVIIIDSISHEWEGAGGILDLHSHMIGNSFMNWNKVTPRHNAFLQAILQAPVHVISTIRSKQDYVLTEKNGKMVPEKVGLKGIQRDGIEYDFTLVFDLDIKNNATASKDRTGLFFGKPEEKLSIETGKKILQWCNEGAEIKEAPIEQRINDCRSIAELLALYESHPQVQQSHLVHFTRKRNELNPDPNIIQLKKQENGTSTNNG